MILVIDNYDSFVENLARYVRQLGYQTQVIRNDQISITEIETLQPTHIILSPGPCTPNEAGICLEVINFFASKIPILGVCLGHQAIAQAFGAKVVQALEPMHGKASLVEHNDQGVFANLVNPLQVARYHSLIVEQLPECLMVTATSAKGEVMAIQHTTFPVFGVQFHPESFLTDSGSQIIKNFLNC